MFLVCNVYKINTLVKLFLVNRHIGIHASIYKQGQSRHTKSCKSGRQNLYQEKIERYILDKHASWIEGIFLFRKGGEETKKLFF